MPLPDLCLLPHKAGDLAPGEPLCAPAQHRTRLWKWHGGGNYLLRTLNTTKFPTSWVARRESFIDSPLLRLFWPPDGNINEVLRNFRKGHFSRVIYFDEDTCLATSPDKWRYALYLSSLGFPVWNERNGETAAFVWSEVTGKPTQRWRVNTTDLEIQNELTKMLANNDSDCASALHWLRLSRRERDRQIYLVQRGTLEEFKSLLRAFVWSGSENDDAKKWILYFSTPTLNVCINDNTPLESLFVSDKNEMLPSKRHKRFLELTRSEFGLHYNLDLVKRRSGLEQLAWSDYVLDVEIPVPTHHERLEAQLHLRDFLRDKVSPEELAELMGQ